MNILISILVIVAVPVLATILFMRQAAFGRRPSGKRKERILRSPQYGKGSFQNRSVTPSLTGGVSMFTVIKDFFFGKHEHRQPAAPVPAVKRSLRSAPGAEPELTWFGHSSYLLRINGLNILVDPVFSERTSPVQYAGTKAFPGANAYAADDMPDIDILLITHDHYDHLDFGTMKKLRDRVGMVVTSLGVGEHLERWGFAADKIKELDWWEQITVGKDTQFTATPARHFSGRGFKRNQTLWSSFVLEAGGYRIFLGGDSGYDTHFAEIGERFGPFDLAILENGQYNVYWANIHMMPEETAQAAIDLKAKVLFPVHWGKFALATHPWNEPVQRVLRKAEATGLRIITPRIGEEVIIGKTYPNRPWWLDIP